MMIACPFGTLRENFAKHSPFKRNGAPVFDAAPADPTATQVQEYVPRKIRERMREMILADVAAAVIAADVCSS